MTMLGWFTRRGAYERGAAALVALLACSSNETDSGSNPIAQGGSGTSAAGAAGATAGVAGASGAAGANGTGPVDLGAPGPHQVTVEENVGEAFRNDVADDVARCMSFIGAINPNSPVATELTVYPADLDRQLYTLFRPTQLAEGQTYPVITWGNGTCAQPRLYVELLTHLASHGFIVVATNWRWTGGGVEMQRGLDFVLAENQNPQSPLFGKVATAMLGASGHSQGSGATITVGADPRIVATVPIQGARAAAVAALKGATFLIAGELDTLVAPAGVEAAFNAATVPAVYGMSVGQDHLMPGQNPAPILKAVTGWFRIHLAGDEPARALFYGDACGLCSDPGWVIKQRNL